MSYCLNPQCKNPQNGDGTKFCQTCGTKLLLRERYRSIKPLGRGGFGITFLAQDEDKPSKPFCVIKQLFPQFKDPDSLKKASELFYQEAERLDQLGQHPQIPDLLAYFEQDNYQYLVQQFISGDNLAQELKQLGAFSEVKIRQLLEDLLPVLQFIHEHQIIHRDVKPENIIRQIFPPPSSLIQGNLASQGYLSRGGISPQKNSQPGQLFLVDFGAAKVLTNQNRNHLGTVIGSPEYIAPEQVRGQAIFASDLYSLGATCIHLLTQISPFDLFDISQNKWVWRSFCSPPISHQLGFILDKLLENNPHHRYQSALQVLQDLHPGYTPTSSPLNIPTQPPSPPPKKTASPPPSPPSWIPLHPHPSWKCQLTLTGHKGSITSIIFSQDRSFFASGSEDKTIEIWKLDSGKRWYTLTGHTDKITALILTPDQQNLISASWDKTLSIWDLKKGKWWYSLVGHHDRINTIALHPQGEILASGSRDKTIQLWNLNKGKHIMTLTGHTEAIQILGFSPDGQQLISGGRDQELKVWDTQKHQLITTLTGHQDRILSLAINPQCPSQGGWIWVTGSRDKTLRVWHYRGDSQQGSLLYTLEPNVGDILSMTFSPDGQILASGHEDGTIYLWEISKGQLLEILKGHSCDVLSLTFRPDGKMLASGSRDRTIKLWQSSE